MDFLFFASTIEKKKIEDKSISHSSNIPILPLSSRNAVKSCANKLPPPKQRLHKLRFLQKVGSQKLFWDQARLSSLVNKPVVLQYIQCSVTEAAGDWRGVPDDHQGILRLPD